MATTPKPDDSPARRVHVLDKMAAQYSPETLAKAERIAAKMLELKALREARPTKAGETDETDTL